MDISLYLGVSRNGDLQTAAETELRTRTNAPKDEEQWLGTAFEDTFDVVNSKPHPFLFWVWSFSLPRMLQLGTAKSANRACPWESHPRFFSLETFMKYLQLRWFDSRFF